MTPRSIRRAAERKANKKARKAAANADVAQNAATMQNLTESQNTTEAKNLTATNFTVPHLSQAQLTANRANAQFSTGPITPTGKSIASRNALKTGLTGRTVLLPTDDAARYQANLETYEAHFQPVGPEEQSLVQSIADTTWRLARIPGLEMAIYAKGRIQFADAFEDHDADERPALIEAEIYLAYEKQIRNLHLQEARLVRRRDKETTELRNLQHDRAALALRAQAPSNQKNLTAQPEIGFDFSTTEFPSQAAYEMPFTLNEIGDEEMAA